MSRPPPILHGPSLAQHRFVALMALWFLVGTLARCFLWLRGGDPLPVVRAGGIAAFIAPPASDADHTSASIRAWPGPGWMIFSATAIIVSMVFLVLREGLVTLLPAHVPSSFSFELLPLLLLELSLLAWYGTWWMLLRKGWADVSSAMIAAGLHFSVLDFLLSLDIAYTFGTKFLPHWTESPVAFFAGWSLMFLPGAVAAHETTPHRAGARSRLKRIAAWTMPALAALIVSLALSSIVPSPISRRTIMLLPT